jgi:hypothetical protein
VRGTENEKVGVGVKRPGIATPRPSAACHASQGLYRFKMSHNETDQEVDGLVRRYTWKLDSDMRLQSSDGPKYEVEAALVENQKYRDDLEMLYERLRVVQ